MILVTKPAKDGSQISAESSDNAEWPMLGSTRTLAEKVYGVVRDRILSSELAPRTHVFSG